MVIFVAVVIVVLFGLAHEMARLQNIEKELKDNSKMLEELRVKNQQTLDQFQQGVRKELKDTRDKLEKVRDKMNSNITKRLLDDGPLLNINRCEIKF